MNPPSDPLVAAIRTTIRLARLAQQVCDENGLTLPQYRGLSIVVADRRRAHEIASYTSTSRPAIASLTAGLERMGLVERETAESDRRGVYYTATDKGRLLIAEIDATMAAKFTEVLGENTALLHTLASEQIEAALDAQIAHDFGPEVTA
ncbi:MarR family winged helix-turn-helix transcriptional regulator [Jiangella sp. DSM 45060]|uniref:MarR family winged helix-turn-helix transcriptional regulator n=1 Tax=Jiangella sp. DSM 45060 TaxID=1798224 RepID=UPI000879C2B4|nr:MarR family transcriptional regulator [Jiangella sp. DSM 45060]SDT32707.1 DNA-binding transcriptional regulator, MarR family [Jiangella sp. DSM 45060]